jgi:threonine dehydrogenase-like Zn-dependent dehydrogenase
VSSLNACLSGRWSKGRRFETVWRQLEAIRPSRWITQHYPVARAPEAYQTIDQQPHQTIQVVLVYD